MITTFSSTGWTTHCFSTQVLAHVIFKVVLKCKCSLANVTLKRFFTSVAKFMPNKRIMTQENFFTKLTFVGLL